MNQKLGFTYVKKNSTDKKYSIQKNAEPEVHEEEKLSDKTLSEKSEIIEEFVDH